MSELNAMALHKLRDENEALRFEIAYLRGLIKSQSNESAIKRLLYGIDDWISVSDDLPKRKDRYQVVQEKDGVRVQLTREFDWYATQIWGDINIEKYGPVTHWRELPPLPTDKSGEQS